LALSIDSNDDYEVNFQNKDRQTKLELFPLLHQVVTSNEPHRLPFVHKLFPEDDHDQSYFFGTEDGKSFITFELQFFGKLQFIACHCE